MLALMNEADRWTLSMPAVLDATVWHAAVLDTCHYADFCRAACAREGRVPVVVDHDPLAFGVGTVDERRARLRDKYERTYGEPPVEEFWRDALDVERGPKKRKHDAVAPVLTFHAPSEDLSDVPVYEIEVVHLTGRIDEYVVERHWTVRDLMLVVFGRTNIPVDQQRMISAGRQLEERRELSVYLGEERRARVHLVLKLRGC